MSEYTHAVYYTTHTIQLVPSLADFLRLPISPSSFSSPLFRRLWPASAMALSTAFIATTLQTAAHMPEVELDYYSLVAIGSVVSAGPYYDPEAQ